MASFVSFEATLKKAIADGVLPGAVVAVQDKSGKINYAKPFGNSSIVPGAETPMDLHTIFPLASMTKLLTSIAALQLIDRGLITPDTDISPYLPALAAQPIIQSLDPETQTTITVPRTKPILLRHLLTHSSGAGYIFLSPLLLPLAKNHPVGPTVPERYDYPLLFEPGTSWAYGAGIDWTGHLIEVITGQDLETYLAENILTPLGLPEKSITFYPERDASILSRVMPLSTRDEVTGRVVPHEGPNLLTNSDPGRAAYGGEAGFADMTSYIEVLGSLLRDDGRLLGSDTAGLLFRPMLGGEGKRGLLEVLSDAAWIVGSLPGTGEYDHSLGGLVVDRGRREGGRGRREGFLQWGGMFNLVWFIDREAGVTACFGTEVAQPGDPLVEKLFVALEEAVYAEARA